MKTELKTAILASLAAGHEIMEIYRRKDLGVQKKCDNSPLTIADQKANEVINKYLSPLGKPIISEENQQIEYLKRKEWPECWIVDPLDGTKEFIKKNDEFTVNIAYIVDGKPEIGVIYAPALKILYFAVVSESMAFKNKIDQPEEERIEGIFRNAQEIKPTMNKDKFRVVGSRSHMNEETKEYINSLKAIHGENLEIVSKGSSLKFCLVAEGEAHIYPRFAPTMEWDTAAGQAICEAVGLKCTWTKTGERITYNRENLLNDQFSVYHER